MPKTFKPKQFNYFERQTLKKVYNNKMETFKGLPKSAPKTPLSKAINNMAYDSHKTWHKNQVDNWLQIKLRSH